MMAAESETKTVKPAPPWDEVQATAAARYNLEIMVRHIRGEITTEQLRAFIAPMQPDEESRAELQAKIANATDAELDALADELRKLGFSTKLITRERRNRKRRAARAAPASSSGA